MVKRKTKEKKEILGKKKKARGKGRQKVMKGWQWSKSIISICKMYVSVCNACLVLKLKSNIESKIYIIIYYATFIITNAYFEKSFHYEALELAMKNRLAWNSQRSTRLWFPSTGIMGVRHHVHLKYFFNRTIAEIEPKLKSRPTVSQSCFYHLWCDFEHIHYPLG